VGHRPPYSSETPHSYNGIPSGDSLIVKQVFEPLLREFKVDLFFAGHVHSYERTYPIYNSTVQGTSYVNPNATVYIVNGAGGVRV